MNGNISENKEMEQEQEQLKSYIHVEFESLGSAVYNIALENVTPNQMMGIVAYLETYAKTLFSNQIVQNLQKQQEQRLSVPKPKLELAK